MYGLKINFKDAYGGVANVHVQANEDFSKMADLLDDFMFITGDDIIDLSAMLVARKFATYLTSLGYINHLNSVERANKQMTFDISSGSISPSVNVDTEELRLPTGGSLVSANGVEENFSGDLTAGESTEGLGIQETELPRRQQFDV
jgi:hypothetical protein